MRSSSRTSRALARRSCRTRRSSGPTPLQRRDPRVHRRAPRSSRISCSFERPERIRAAIKADRAQLKAELAAAKAVKGAGKQLRPVVKSTRTAVKADRTAIKDALKQARQAVKELRSSFSKGAHAAPAKPGRRAKGSDRKV